MKVARILWVLLLGLVLAGCASPPLIESGQPGGIIPASALSNASGLYRFKRIKCADDRLPVEIVCGQLTVPADHNAPQSGKVHLAVTILKARTDQPAPDPVVYLAGGPGAGATAELQRWVDHPLLEQRDLILVDQRGAGLSRPSLDCPEFEKGGSESKQQDIRACRNRLINRGINFAIFNSIQSAADLETLRQVLGYPAWNLLAVSYGTRLAQTMLHQYPESVRSVILDSTYPLQINAFQEQAANQAQAIHAVFAACASDLGCAYAYPDLKAVFDELLASLDQNPAEVIVPDPTTGQQIRVYLDGAEMTRLVAGALENAETIARIPYVIYETYYNKHSAIAGLMFPVERQHTQQTSRNTGAEVAGDSEGLYYSVFCQEDVAYSDQAKTAGQRQVIEQQSGDQVAGYLMDDSKALFDTCRSWGTDTTNPPQTDAVRSPVPALILAGEYDPLTPPAWGAATSENLPGSFFYRFPGQGHGFSDSDTCAQQMIAQFLNKPGQAPDEACIDKGGVDFWLP
jgi:pimeloyl-ACP methyl ester carboxylesterase